MVERLDRRPPGDAGTSGANSWRNPRRRRRHLRLLEPVSGLRHSLIGFGMWPHAICGPVCRSGAAKAGVPLAADVAEKLATYYELLARWNLKINLTAITDADEAIDRLLLEPLTAAKSPSIVWQVPGRRIGRWLTCHPASPRGSAAAVDHGRGEGEEGGVSYGRRCELWGLRRTSSLRVTRSCLHAPSSTKRSQLYRSGRFESRPGYSRLFRPSWSRRKAALVPRSVRP